MSRLAAFRQLSRRRRWAIVVAVLIAFGALAAVSAYAMLVLTTLNAPPPVGLLSASPDTSFDRGDPAGEWVIDEHGDSFAGYRAREILAFEWIRSPNDAVGRTKTVDGRLVIANGQLTTAEISVNVAQMRSDSEMRDGHVVEYLDLRQLPNATFRLTTPIDISGAAPGDVVHVAAQGELTILDATRPVTFPLEARWTGDHIEVAGELQLSRADYGMDVSQLLAFRVADTITIELQLVFSRPCPDPCTVATSPSPRPSASPSPTSRAPAEVSVFTSDVGQLLVVTVGGTEPTLTSIQESDLYLITPGTGALRNVSTSPLASEFTPAISPDGTTIAYVRGEAELWLLPIAGGEARRLVTEPSVHLMEPDWSPDGSWIAAVRNPDEASSLVRVDPATGALTTLLDLPGVEATPRLSPDGRTIVFSYFETNANSQQIYLADANGSNPRPLTSGDTYDYSPTWSPDGSSIAFIRDGNLGRIAATGGTVDVLSHDGTADQPAWSPDGAYLAFIEGWRDELQLLRLDDASVGRVPELFEVVSNPVWLPR